jgi:C1A family cysteine protease
MSDFLTEEMIVQKYKRPKYHCVNDTPDDRDFKYTLTGNTLPPVVDLRQWASPIDDQGNLGSCTGNAIAGAIDLMDNKNYKKHTQVSRLFIYYYERLLEGTVSQDSGAQIRDGIKVGHMYGAPLESLWPYDIRNFTHVPSAAAIADAAKRKIIKYQNAPDFLHVKDAIAAGYPVVIGFSVYSSFESPEVAATGNMPMPNVNTEQALGGHAVCIVGYDDHKQHFIVRNSWGTSWGDKGYFYMPYGIIQNPNLSRDFWVIQTSNDPS